MLGLSSATLCFKILYCYCESFVIHIEMIQGENLYIFLKNPLNQNLPWIKTRSKKSKHELPVTTLIWDNSLYLRFENIWKTITLKFLRCECLYLVSSLSKRSLDFPLYDCWNVFIKKNKLPSADPSLYINVTVFLTVLFSFWYCVVSFCGMNTDFLQLFSISWVCLKLELLFILHRINN